MDDLITVIVPAYNIEQYIERAVHSICSQTYSNLEIILVDDGSSDRTGDLIDELQRVDKRLVVIHKKNGGVTSARIAGLEKAHGEWIGFVDGDDYIEEGMYARLLNNAKKYDADISHCGYRMVFPDREDLYYGKGILLLQDKDKGVEDLLRGDYVEPALVNKLYRRKIVEETLHQKDLDLTIRHFEDLLMNFYLFQRSGRSVYEDICFYHYMVRENSAATSGMSLQKLKDPLTVLKTIREKVKKNSLFVSIIDRRIIYQLIKISVLNKQECQGKMIDARRNARKELREQLPDILKFRHGKKLDIMALWVIIWPSSYRWVHNIYARLSGIDRKYRVS